MNVSDRGLGRVLQGAPGLHGVIAGLHRVTPGDLLLSVGWHFEVFEICSSGVTGSSCCGVVMSSSLNLQLALRPGRQGHDCPCAWH